MIVYGLYRENTLVYIGQTRSSIQNRVSKHFSDAKLKKNVCMNIVKAIIKYGKEAFSYKILKECDSIEEMNTWECQLISQYNPRYNIALGGSSGLGHSEKTRKLIGDIQKKKIECVTDGICFNSVIEAEAFYNTAGTIGRVAKGHRKAFRGKQFKFIGN